MYFDLLS